MTTTPIQLWPFSEWAKNEPTLLDSVSFEEKRLALLFVLWFLFQRWWYAWCAPTPSKLEQAAADELPRPAPDHLESPIYDVVHSRLPLPTWLQPYICYAPDLMAFFLLALAYVGYVESQADNPWPLFEYNTERWLLLQSMRCFTSTATHFPSPIPAHTSHRPFSSPHHYDLMFSGHTVTYWYAFNLIAAYTPHMWGPAIVHALLGCLASVYSREHYTADVLVATALSWVVYNHD